MPVLRSQKSRCPIGVPISQSFTGPNRQYVKPVGGLFSKGTKPTNRVIRELDELNLQLKAALKAANKDSQSIILTKIQRYYEKLIDLNPTVINDELRIKLDFFKELKGWITKNNYTEVLLKKILAQFLLLSDTNKELELSNCNLTQMPPNNVLQHFKTIDLSNNQITSWTGVIEFKKECIGLTTLDFKGNKLDEKTIGTFEKGGVVSANFQIMYDKPHKPDAHKAESKPPTYENNYEEMSATPSSTASSKASSSSASFAGGVAAIATTTADTVAAMASQLGLGLTERSSVSKYKREFNEMLTNLPTREELEAKIKESDVLIQKLTIQEKKAEIEEFLAGKNVEEIKRFLEELYAWKDCDDPKLKKENRELIMPLLWGCYLSNASNSFTDIYGKFVDEVRFEVNRVLERQIIALSLTMTDFIKEEINNVLANQILTGTHLLEIEKSIASFIEGKIERESQVVSKYKREFDAMLATLPTIEALEAKIEESKSLSLTIATQKAEIEEFLVEKNVKEIKRFLKDLYAWKDCKDPVLSQETRELIMPLLLNCYRSNDETKSVAEIYQVVMADVKQAAAVAAAAAAKAEAEATRNLGFVPAEANDMDVFINEEIDRVLANQTLKGRNKLEIANSIASVIEAKIRSESQIVREYVVEFQKMLVTLPTIPALEVKIEEGESLDLTIPEKKAEIEQFLAEKNVEEIKRFLKDLYAWKDSDDAGVKQENRESIMLLLWFKFVPSGCIELSALGIDLKQEDRISIIYDRFVDEMRDEVISDLLRTGGYITNETKEMKCFIKEKVKKALKEERLVDVTLVEIVKNIVKGIVDECKFEINDKVILRYLKNGEFNGKEAVVLKKDWWTFNSFILVEVPDVAAGQPQKLQVGSLHLNKSNIALNDVVRIDGIKSKPQLNGRLGTVQEFVEDSGRALIKLTPVVGDKVTINEEGVAPRKGAVVSLNSDSMKVRLYPAVNQPGITIKDHDIVALNGIRCTFQADSAGQARVVTNVDAKDAPVFFTTFVAHTELKKILDSSTLKPDGKDAIQRCISDKTLSTGTIVKLSEDKEDGLVTVTVISAKSEPKLKIKIPTRLLRDPYEIWVPYSTLDLVKSVSNSVVTVDTTPNLKVDNLTVVTKAVVGPTEDKDDGPKTKATIEDLINMLERYRNSLSTPAVAAKAKIEKEKAAKAKEAAKVAEKKAAPAIKELEEANTKRMSAIWRKNAAAAAAKAGAEVKIREAEAVCAEVRARVQPTIEQAVVAGIAAGVAEKEAVAAEVAEAAKIAGVLNSIFPELLDKKEETMDKRIEQLKATYKSFNSSFHPDKLVQIDDSDRERKELIVLVNRIRRGFESATGIAMQEVEEGASLKDVLVRIHGCLSLYLHNQIKLFEFMKEKLSQLESKAVEIIPELAKPRLSDIEVTTDQQETSQKIIHGVKRQVEEYIKKSGIEAVKYLAQKFITPFRFFYWHYGKSSLAPLPNYDVWCIDLERMVPTFKKDLITALNRKLSTLTQLTEFSSWDDIRKQLYQVYKTKMEQNKFFGSVGIVSDVDGIQV